MHQSVTLKSDSWVVSAGSGVRMLQWRRHGCRPWRVASVSSGWVEQKWEIWIELRRWVWMRVLISHVSIVLVRLTSQQQLDSSHVGRYTSHETSSRTHWPCAHITLWLKVSERVSDNQSCTCHHMFERSLSVFVLSSSSPSRASTFSLTVYLFCILLINFHVAGTAEDFFFTKKNSTHAQWGVIVPWRYTTLSHFNTVFNFVEMRVFQVCTSCQRVTWNWCPIDAVAHLALCASRPFSFLLCV